MKYWLAAFFVVFSCFSNISSAQETKVPIKIKAIVFDRDLNQKPVAKTRFKIASVQDGEFKVEIVTSFDGLAEIDLLPGNYRVTSIQPLEFQNKRYEWNFEISVKAPQTTVEISNDNATTAELARNTAAEDLVSVYKQYRNSVVTILAEYGPAKGTGFILDSSGIVLTNQHVVRTSEFIAVVLDDKRRLPAKVIAADSQKDIAVLWVNFEKVTDVIGVPLLHKGDIPAEEGEKVFTIGSPLHQSKIMTTGIVSKIEKRAIISDVNINHGNSGGPLFNSKGFVVGITTFGDMSEQGGPGISGIVRIEEAYPILEQAKANMATGTKPSPDFLPNDPEDKFPLDAIKSAALTDKFDTKPYIFGVGDYDVAVVTPILQYRHLNGGVEAGKQKDKRNRKSAAAVQGSFQPLDDLKGWQEYLGQYQPVIHIQVSPKMKETFWSALGRGMAASHGYAPGPANLHFKTDFYKMKLMCGDKEVAPIFPGKAERVLNVSNAAVRITDATFDGFYEYPYDAIRPDCGKMTLQIFSEKDPNAPKIKELDTKTVNAVFGDFAPYRKQLAEAAPSTN